LPLDDCLYALQATVPHLTRSSLHRLFERHDISRLPQAEGARPRQAFKPYPLGYIHIDFAVATMNSDRNLYLLEHALALLTWIARNACKARNPRVIRR
jgi:hypothetical protein